MKEGGMKIIIDIPKGTYEAVKLGVVNQVLVDKVWKAVRRGTPFDSVIEDIKAEIRAEQEKYSHPLEIERAIEILDNIGAEMRGGDRDR